MEGGSTTPQPRGIGRGFAVLTPQWCSPTAANGLRAAHRFKRRVKLPIDAGIVPLSEFPVKVLRGHSVTVVTRVSSQAQALRNHAPLWEGNTIATRLQLRAGRRATSTQVSKACKAAERVRDGARQLVGAQIPIVCLAARFASAAARGHIAGRGAACRPARQRSAGTERLPHGPAAQSCLLSP